MIKYNCTSCGTELETDDSRSGTREDCPICRKANTVPLSQRDLDGRKKQREERLRQESTEYLQQAGTQSRAPQAQTQSEQVEEILLTDLATEPVYRGPVLPRRRTTRDSHTALVWASFLLPLYGLIVGAIFMMKEQPENRRIGQICVKWAVIGIVVGSVAIGILWGTLVFLEPHGHFRNDWPCIPW